MRFVITGEWKRNSLLRLVIFMFMIFIALFWLTSALMYFRSMSLKPASVVAHYRGKVSKNWFDAKSQRVGARSYRVMLEVTHSHLIWMAILLMTLTHLVLFVPLPSPAKFWLVLLTFLSALFNESAGWLVRFVSPHFAWFKIGSFLLLQISLLATIVVMFLTLILNWRNAYGDKHGHP